MGAHESITVVPSGGEFGVTESDAECLKKLVLWNGPETVNLIDSKLFLEKCFPGIGQEIGIPENLPPFECYLLGCELFSEILKPEDRESNEADV